MFPDYVIQYKKKGYKIKEINNHYYLYKVTSSRIEGYKYPQEKDIYLGVITDKGLIQPKKVPMSITTYEYGISMYLMYLANKYIDGCSINVKVKVVLSLMYGVYLYDCHYKSSYLSIVYPNIKVYALNQSEKQLTHKIQSNINYHDYNILFNIQAINIDNKWILSNLTQEQKETLKKYAIKEL